MPGENLQTLELFSQRFSNGWNSGILIGDTTSIRRGCGASGNPVFFLLPVSGRRYAAPMNKTNSWSTDRWTDVVLLAGSLLIVFLFGLRTISGADLWFHLAAGRQVMTAGPASVDPFSFGLPAETAWRQVTWLYDVLVFQVWRFGGAPLTVLLHVAAVLAGFLAVAPALRRYAGRVHQATALLLCAWVLAPMFSLRPLLFCLAFLGAFLGLLSRERLTWREGAALVVLQALWANMHVSFALGPVLVLLRALEAIRQPPPGALPAEPDQPRAFYGTVMIAVLAVTLMNPFGFGVWREAIRALLHPEGRVMLEWISPFYGDFIPVRLTVFTTTLLALIAAVFIFRRERLPLVFTGAAVISAYALVQSGHYLEVCALLAFPFAAMSLAVVSDLVGRWLPERLDVLVARAGRAALTLALVFSAFWIVTNRYYVHSGSASGFGLRVNTDIYPVAVVQALNGLAAPPERMINLAQDGGYLLWQRPGTRVFTDPRGALYGGLFFNRLSGELTGHVSWRDGETPLIDSDAILLNATWTGARTALLNLLSKPQWSIAYFDGVSVLLLRKTSANAPLLEDAEWSRRGLALIQADYARYQRALTRRGALLPNPARLIGAASMYHVLGRFSESLAILELITRGSPRMVAAWVNRGIAEVETGRIDAAVTTLRHASDLLPNHPLPLLWLSKAYQLAGRESEAAVALQKARDLNKGFAERFEAEQTLLAPSSGFTVPETY